MAKAIMIQGTMSNVGKSLITAGLCRIFKQDGYRTAPFKSQNMALNSFITQEGLEMGRAQVMQAEAAGIKPHVNMNPVLLKPTGDMGSQVIVNGEVLGNMRAAEYFSYKKQLLPQITKAYQALSAEYDIIVIEGAGSPAEINLKSDDIVNMGMAKLAGAPVILIGDVDRGGVFAQLIGTILLLEEEEKKRVKGMIVNKFRGDETILKPGIVMLEEKTDIPVLGTVPYMELDIEDEDSLTERFRCTGSQRPIDIAVIKLKRIANFTDFNLLQQFEPVSLRYVDKVSALKQPDMIILPGTKNTMGDLKWMKENGLYDAVIAAKSRGAVIFGICGGYQMLGTSIRDPHCTEAGGEMEGLGLLPIETVFTKEKTRTRVKGTLKDLTGTLKSLSGLQISGYEIHMGQSNAAAQGVLPVTELGTGREMKTEGGCQEDVYGTYVHGIFDSDGVLPALIQALAHKKGVSLPDLKPINYKEYKEKQYDRLADTLRAYINMGEIYKIMEEGI